jgi:hypothetical protein
MKFETIHEAETLLCEQIDLDKHIIRGVKLIGLTSKNGRRYLESALREAVPMYEGAKVNLNHNTDPKKPVRDYQDRFGIIRNVEFREGAGNFGDLHYNPKHPAAEQFIWDAQMQPTNVGMSHHVQAKIAKSGQETVVEAIQRVKSVDVVADPGTTDSLFENEEPEPIPAPENTETTPLPALTLEQLESEYPQLVTEIRNRTIRQQMEAGEALLKANLPAIAIDRIFLEAYCTADQETRIALIQTRRELVESLQKAQPVQPKSNPPRSNPKSDEPITKDVKEFATAIKR